MTEGEDKPLKYPTIFNSADIAVITRSDLAEAAEFDWAAVQRNVESVRPGMTLTRLSAKKGKRMPEWIALLNDRRDQWRRSVRSSAPADTPSVSEVAPA